jgi:Flp pilus assembly pilin Flp
MRRLTLMRRLAREECGVTIVEFAMIAPALCLTLLALFDFGHRSYVESVVQGALHEAARLATVGDKTGDEIDAHVENMLLIFSHDGEVEIEKKSYADFSGVGKPEKITQDTAPVNEYNEGDCFEDANGNGEYDEDRGRGGLGNAEDVVHYRVTIEFPRLVPLGGFLGLGPTETVTASTVLRNQPFAARTGVAIVC